ncbi:MAG: hypothetical protein CMP39_04600 [Rickettsiales bacterium]|nr:hypothetical protein [Rickettsiales bacterium]|tara:strand:+ start:1580 stop:2404 length:825 start_codon:yes stop_codon:yes gene_type:complete
MKKTVILDGKKRYKNQYETINLIISNQKIIGVGYLPDDEESNKINAKNHLLVPNIINFTHLFSKEIKRLKNNGISKLNNAVLNCENVDSSPNNPEFIIHENLAYDENNNEILKIYKMSQKPILTKVQFSEMNFIIDKYKNSEIELHFILNYYDKNILNSIESNPYKNFTFGLIIDTIHEELCESITKQILENKIVSISTMDDNILISNLSEIAKQNLPEVFYKLYDENLYKIFKIKNKNFAMLSRPNISAIKTPQNDSEKTTILTTISDGVIIQ